MFPHFIPISLPFPFCPALPGMSYHSVLPGSLGFSCGDGFSDFPCFFHDLDSFEGVGSNSL